MKKRLISFFMTLCMAVSVIPMLSIPAAAQLTSRTDWIAQRTINLIPQMNEKEELAVVGWNNIDNEINTKAQVIDNSHGGDDYDYPVGIQALGSSDDIGNKQYGGGVYWQIDFSDEDKVKINKGDLYLNSSARYWIQKTATHYMSLRFEFFDEKNSEPIDSRKETLKKSQPDLFKPDLNVLINLNDVQIPKNTSYVKIWFSNWGSLGGRPFIGDFKAYISDKTAPKLVTPLHEYSVNESTQLPSYVVPHDILTYVMKFDEAVRLVKYVPTFYLSDGSRIACNKYTYSSDRQTIYFPLKLWNSYKNVDDLKITKITGLYIQDDAQNELNFSGDNLSYGSIPYKAVYNIIQNLNNIDFSGDLTANYGFDYSAQLTPKEGYKLPSNISIKINGNSLSDSEYTYDSTDGKIKIGYSAIRGDIEITAAGLPQTYTVTFDMQGGSDGTQSISATYTQAMPNVTPPKREGYAFGGYYDKPNGTGARYYDINGLAYGSYDKPYDATLYAKWTPNNYTVTLDAMGGTNSGTYTAVYGEEMPSITLPERKGYTFLGYFTETGGQGKKYYNADGTSARVYDKADGLMLYAAWSVNSYTVTFDMWGGKGGTASTTAVYDEKMPSITPPTREGYTFGGYFESEFGGTQYYYANGEGAKAYDTDGAITLYAKWAANTYDVVLNAQGGSGGSTVTAVFDDAMPVINAPDKPGYLFGGYFTAPNGEGKKYYNADCSSANLYDKAEGITLYALWTPITYNIQLYSRGENAGTLTDVVYGNLKLPSAEEIGITYPNYNFVGWNIYDEQNWAMYTAGRTYSAGLVTEQGKTAYIYAAWLEKDKYTVTYDANGGEGAPSAVTVHVDETINLSANIPSRQDYTFVGWSESSDSVSAQYQPNDSFTMGNSLVTLFAVWKKNPELIYNANGGVFNTYAGSSYPAAGSLVKLTDAVPQKDGYMFCGWAESENATKADTIADPYTMPDRDTVLYAVYEPVKYTLSVSAADGYTVSGINADGYTFGEYAEFTVSGNAPKVYINGVLTHPINGAYKIEMKADAAVVISDNLSINVIYSANGGINAPIDMNIYANGGAAIVKTTKPTRKGYIFKGWADTEDSDYAQYTGGENIPVIAEDIVLYAVWEPTAYTIKYDANGGKGTITDTPAVYDNEVTLSKNAFSKTGSHFAGWAYSRDGEIAYANGAVVKNLTDVQNGEITLYAVWKGAKTRINFNFEGGSTGTASCEAVYGKALPSGKLMPPKRYGYTFLGYYTDKNKGGDLVYNADMMLSEYYETNPWNSGAEEFALYAAWEPISYKITFVDETKTLDTISAVYGDVFTLPKAETLGVSVANGYTFAGWSAISGSDAVYYRDGQEITSGLAGESDAEVILYAVVQKEESYKVTLPASKEGYKVYYNNSEITAQKDISVNKGDNISFKICVEDGYTADKMTVSANGIMLGAVQIDGSSYTYSLSRISADTSINIYHVKKESFRIILNDGTGYSISPKNTVVDSGDDFAFTVTLSDGYKTAVPVVFVNGSTLFGTKNNDTFTYTVRAVTSQPVISVSVAKKPQHTVTFISNGNIYSIGTVEENMKAIQPSAPERSGYTFGGWYSDTALSQPYDFQTEVADDIKLYAKWTADTYAVEYNKNTDDDVSVPTSQTKKHDTVLTLSSQTPSRIGYNFKDWNTRANGTGASYGAGAELSVNADIMLYAQWEIKKFAVSLITGEGVTGTLGANEAEYNGTVNVSAVSGDGYNSPVITAVPQENAELISEGVYKIKGPVSFVASALPKKIYTASFYLDGGLYHTQSAIEGSADTVKLPNPPIKSGYTFLGWYTEKTSGIKVDGTTVIDKDLAVYARFIVNTLNIVPAVSGTGYTVESNDSTDVSCGGSYSFKIKIADRYNADSMKVYANGILLTPSVNGNEYSYTVENITVNQSITVTGVELQKYTITYMIDGQIYSTVQSEFDSLLSEPVSPEKAGETFKGWSNGQRIWNFGTDRVTADMTLYPVWESGVLSVTPAVSGTGYTVESNDSTDVSYGGSYSFKIKIADHYNADNMKVYANGILLLGTKNGNVYEFTVKNITDNVIINVYDVTADIYTVKYIADNETYYTQKVVYNNKAQKPKSPIKPGYTFTGWFKGETQWSFDAEICEDLELEAKFEPLHYKVSVPENRSEFTVNVTSDSQVEHGGSFSFNITAADGYNVSDMTVYANGILLEKKSENGDTVYFEISNITEETVVTVRGIGQNTYSVTYNANTAEYVGNMPTSAIKAYGTDITISELIPERYGYTFKGWAILPDGEAEYSDGSVYSGNADIKLYAVWEAKTFSVSFETNGGTVNAGEITQYTYGKGALLPTDVAKSGYTFLGWYEDELTQGARVYEIKENDFGDKKYYAAYTMANIIVSGYTGEYDGNTHDITYTLPADLSVEKYQWYFVPFDSNDAIPVSSDTYNTYTVKNVSDNGEYYCYIEAVQNSYVIRFFTEKATAAISKKPITIKAADGSKIYDALPLTAGTAELTGESGLADTHTFTVSMTEDSTITNVGTKENIINSIIIKDGENTDVTANYEITAQKGTLTVTPLTLTVSPKDLTISRGSVLNESRLYEISGTLGNEKLALANTSVTAKNADGTDISFDDVTKNVGTYTITIAYSGFTGDGSENYQGNGTITSAVTVYRPSSSGSSGSSGGGSSSVSTPTYTVTFDTNGGEKLQSQSVKKGGKAAMPETPAREGYEFDGWYSDNALTQEFDFSENITKNIALYAKWTQIKQDEDKREENPSESNPTKTGVSKLLETENHISYLNGYDGGIFKPESNMTRAEAAQMFYNLLLDKNISGKNAFSDVSLDAWYYNAVTKLSDMGIIKGVGENRFNPDGEITRAEFVAIAMRFVSIDVNGSADFSDVSQNHWAAKDISSAAALGWISGNDDGTFEPNAQIKRSAVAKIVNNMLGRKADIEYVNTHTDDIKQFKDVSDTAWYYNDVIEAANTHKYEKSNGNEIWK